MKKLSMALAAFSGLIVAAPALVPTAAIAAPGDSQALDVNAAANLAARINAEVARLPATASPADVEGAMIAVLGGTSANSATVGSALSQVSVTSPAVAQALAKVRLAMAEKFNENGSKSSRGNYGNQSFASTFSSPSVSVGGGSSDYSKKQ